MNLYAIFYAIKEKKHLNLQKNMAISTLKKKQKCPQIKGNSDGSGCKVIFELGIPNI
jgi:hypothetical protein